ncbi:gamma-glutamylcyclotransferase family protein [Planococcus lenghuensis]|uniref:Gamma-glutamylcyclotransferase family protein n=1 Tax=Planococcus lenghuensis TaxID=2213202 RepID=A0A1Q2L3D4_9BACL|nr:gamma-glutamylcyclotransferase [Planococcus lenghuensis]AQQ54923.1 branched-chain alpha-keto acid dehydrogenase [Planococcus lenghuensis]
MNLFVYGTLKQGGKYHHYLKNAKRVLPDAMAKGTLYDTNLGYPAMTLEGKGKVRGEVYEVPEQLWPHIDELEDCTGSSDDLYKKVTIEVQSESGRQAVITYVAKDERLLHKQINSGNWDI